MRYLVKERRGTFPYYSKAEIRRTLDDGKIAIDWPAKREEGQDVWLTVGAILDGSEAGTSAVEGSPVKAEIAPVGWVGLFLVVVCTLGIAGLFVPKSNAFITFFWVPGLVGLVISIRAAFLGSGRAGGLLGILLFIVTAVYSEMR
jgi:hypothetical protein